MYKKLKIDELRDTNSRRKEQRNVNVGQKVFKPLQNDKRLIQTTPEQYQK